MKIEINNSNTEVVTTLISKFLELNSNSNSNFNYLNNDNIVVGYNENSGFSYIYLENEPHISLVSDYHDTLCLVYSSGLDGIEFIKYDLDNINSLEDLETEMNKAYTLEDDIRGDDYDNADLIEKFSNEMYNNGWMDL